MRVSIHTPTGRVLEMQSHATAGTLLANAQAAGHPAGEVEEREVTPAEYAALFAARPPTDEEHDAALLAELSRLDGRKARALTDALLTGDHSRLRALEEEAAALRSRLRGGAETVNADPGGANPAPARPRKRKGA